MTYNVGLFDFEVPEEVYQQLKTAHIEDDPIIPDVKPFAALADWLRDNIKEGDALDWECQIEDVS